MYYLMGGPAAPFIAFALACIAAWKAAELLEADNMLMAFAVGAAFAFVIPFIVNDMIAVAVADAMPPVDGEDDFVIYVPRMVTSLARVGFALLGVTAWCSFERTA